MFGKFAFILAAGLAGGASPAVATTIAGTYFEDTASFNCVNSSACQIPFPVLPSTLDGKFVNFELLNCSINSAQPAIHLRMLVTDAGQNGRREQYLDPPAGTGYRSFSRPFKYKVAGGPPRKIYVAFFFAGLTASQGSCNLIGTITTQ